MAGYSVTFTVVDNATKQIDQINRRIAAMHAPIERMSRSVQKFIDVSGLKKIADGFNWIARAAGTVLRSLTAIVPVLGTITGAATITGMVKLVSSFAAWGNQLKTNADQIGITTDELQKFQDATMRAGGNAQDMTETLKELHKISADAFTGMNRDAMAYFKRFNIDVADANGHLKSATQLLPEVFHALDSLKDPADRSRVAAALLGDAQAKLYEEYKQSGKPLEEWLALEEKHQRATDQQLESLNKYRLAVAGLETSFDQLGRQVSATLADDLTPLIKDLDEWVVQHQPEIIKAVDDITKSFEAWTQRVDWGQVKDDINGIVKLLRVMLEVAEAVGKAIEKTMFLFGLSDRQFTKEDVLKNSPWYAQLTDEQKAMVRQQVGISEQDYTKAQQPQPGVSFTQSPMQWLGNRIFRGGQGNAGTSIPTGSGAQPLVDRAIRGPANLQPGVAGAPLAPGAQKSAFYDDQRQLIYDAAVKAGLPHPDVVAEVGATQATLESGGGAHTPGGFNVYGIKSGGGVGGAGAPVSTQEEGAGGRYTTQASFATFQSKQDAADAYVQFLLKNPRHYSAVTNAATVEEGLKAQGASGYATASNYGPSLDAIHRQYGAPTQLAQAPPAAPPAAAPPVNGAVSVDITHRNPPPDASVTAQGSGAVNVAPPRIEHPQLDFTTA